MNSTKDVSGDLVLVERAIVEARAGLDVSTARVEQLLYNAFEDPKRAIAAYQRIIQQKGVDETIRILNSEGFFGRLHQFGFTRAALFARGSRHVAKQALRELPEAIRDREAIIAKLNELKQARHKALERADMERLEARRRENVQQIHNRSRSRE